MILRRFTQHLTGQNWFAVGLDVIVLIIGIFLGMQVTDWNEQRKEQSHADKLHARLYRDLMDDADSLGKRLIYWTKSADYGENAIHFLETGDMGGHSNWETLLALYQASNLWRFSPNQTTYTEMMSNGDFVLIRNEVLRDDVAEYYTNFERRRSGLVYDMLPKYRFIIRAAFDYNLQRRIQSQCHAEEMFNQFFIDCPALISEAAAAGYLEQFKNRQDILGSLRYWMSSMRIGMFQAEKDKETSLKLAARVKEEGS